jgi:hypothetical protein
VQATPSKAVSVLPDLLCKQGTGSIPVTSTNLIPTLPIICVRILTGADQSTNHSYEDTSARASRHSILEGIQDGYVEGREIALVSSDHGEAVNASRGGHHCVLTQRVGTTVH